MAMIAITTSNSISVKPTRPRQRDDMKGMRSPPTKSDVTARENLAVGLKLTIIRRDRK
jgi:hypothetical protein